MASREPYQVILASSRDVRAARDCTATVVGRVNDRLGDGTSLELLRWETHAIEGLRPDGPAGLINRDLDQADVVVLIVWNRIDLGASEALAEALVRWQRPPSPVLLAYICDAPSVLMTETECLQRIEVLKTREVLQRAHALRTYEGLDDFGTQLEGDLLEVVRAPATGERAARAPATVPASVNGSTPCPPPPAERDEQDAVSRLLSISRQLLSS